MLMANPGSDPLPAISGPPPIRNPLPTAAANPARREAGRHPIVAPSAARKLSGTTVPSPTSTAGEAAAQQEQILAEGHRHLSQGRSLEAALCYQRVTQANPTNASALLALSLIARHNKQLPQAVALAQAAAQASPKALLAWVGLANALRATGEMAEAEAAFRRALALDGLSTQAHLGLGDLLNSLSRPLEALPHFQGVVQRHPSLPGGHYGLGNTLACLGRNQAAHAAYRQALALAPRMAEAHFALGFVEARLGNSQKAIQAYRRALGLRPAYAAAWLNLGILLANDSREGAAETCYREALRLSPAMASVLLNLGHLERARGNRDRALELYRQALAIEPNRMEILLAMCHFELDTRNVVPAREWLERARLLDPEHGEAINALGILLHAEGRNEEAIAAFDRAMAVGNKPAESNRANVLLDLGRFDEALRAHEASAEANATHAGARYNLALTRLRMGDFARGWQDYEARWEFREVHRRKRRFREPRWQGEPLEGRRILLFAEQGMGDTIQFCRYAPLVAARGGQIVLEVQNPSLARLMSGILADPSVEVGSMVADGSGKLAVEIALRGHRLPAFDLQCPLMSLPAVFGTTLDSVPARAPYLAADPELVAQRMAQFPQLAGCGLDSGEGPRSSARIGIAWAGNPKYKADAQRSTRLATLLPILTRAAQFPARARGDEESGAPLWFTLQKGDAALQIDELLRDQGHGGALATCLFDGCSQDADFAETAALIDRLDLVITTDTSIAHLAGALGKPLWLLLPHLSDWRWMQQIETTPWYPTARLFRQPAPGDWSTVIERVQGELDLWLRRGDR